MGKRQSDWGLPPDWAFQFGMMFGIPALVILGNFLLPVLGHLESAKFQTLFYEGLGLGCLGVGLLFFARWPLYRQGHFFSFGPSKLSNLRRKIYWVSYAMILAAIMLFRLLLERTN
jgi:hypothetical protein